MDKVPHGVVWIAKSDSCVIGHYMAAIAINNEKRLVQLQREIEYAENNKAKRHHQADAVNRDRSLGGNKQKPDDDDCRENEQGRPKYFLPQFKLNDRPCRCLKGVELVSECVRELSPVKGKQLPRCELRSADIHIVRQLDRRLVLRLSINHALLGQMTDNL